MFLGSWHDACCCLDGYSSTVSVPSHQQSLTAARVQLGVAGGLSTRALTTAHTAVPRLRGPQPFTLLIQYAHSECQRKSRTTCYCRPRQCLKPRRHAPTARSHRTMRKTPSSPYPRRQRAFRRLQRSTHQDRRCRSFFPAALPGPGSLQPIDVVTAEAAPYCLSGLRGGLQGTSTYPAVASPSFVTYTTEYLPGFRESSG